MRSRDDGHTGPSRISGALGVASVSVETGPAAPRTAEMLKAAWLHKLETRCRGSLRKSLQHAFHQVDSDGDGLIGPAEFLRLIANTGEALGVPEAAELFSYWDRDRTGSVSYRCISGDMLPTAAPSDSGIVARMPSNIEWKAGGKQCLSPVRRPGPLDGGAYEEQWKTSPIWTRGSSDSPTARHAEAAGNTGSPVAQHGKNAASCEGGIFGGPLSAAGPHYSPKKNNTSLPGGPFAADPSSLLGPASNTRLPRSNNPSVQGGIFAPSTPLRLMDGPEPIIGL